MVRAQAITFNPGEAPVALAFEVVGELDALADTPAIPSSSLTMVLWFGVSPVAPACFSTKPTIKLPRFVSACWALVRLPLCNALPSALTSCASLPLGLTNEVICIRAPKACCAPARSPFCSAVPIATRSLIRCCVRFPDGVDDAGAIVGNDEIPVIEDIAKPLFRRLGLRAQE